MIRFGPPFGMRARTYTTTTTGRRDGYGDWVGLMSREAKNFFLKLFSILIESSKSVNGCGGGGGGRGGGKDDDTKRGPVYYVVCCVGGRLKSLSGISTAFRHGASDLMEHRRLSYPRGAPDSRPSKGGYFSWGNTIRSRQLFCDDGKESAQQTSANKSKRNKRRWIKY
jgi:hypothetical protein